MSSQSIIINGRTAPFETGESILDAAKKIGIEIPTLCFLKKAAPTGVCGVCAVEIDGAPDLVTACNTPASQGMVIRTESPKVVARRKAVIKNLLSSGNHNCAVCGTGPGEWERFQALVQGRDNAQELCPVWGDCELQNLAFLYQVQGENAAKPAQEFPKVEINPFIVRDYARCIGCGRCAQACNSVQVNDAINYVPGEAKAGEFPLANEDCVFCGECIQACPVGALVEKNARYTVRPWETKKVRTTCSYCGVGCQLWLHVKDNRVVKVTGVEEVGPNWGSLCVKGRFGFHFVGHEERLTTPLIKENGKFREASWDEALDLVAKKLGEIRDASGPDAFGLLTSARVTNEENYIAQKFARAVIKTNNVDHCARL